MKKNNRLFILFVLLLLTPIKAPAGEQNQQLPVKGEIIDTFVSSESLIGQPHPPLLGHKMSPAELDRLRGKGYGCEPIDYITASTGNRRVILWDENSSSVSKRIQDMNVNSGIGGNQANSLVFRDH